MNRTATKNEGAVQTLWRSNSGWPAPLRLLLALCSIAIVWCLILPRVATQNDVQRQLKFLEHHKIDPSAMFYTELEAMEPILERLEH